MPKANVCKYDYTTHKLVTIHYDRRPTTRVYNVKEARLFRVMSILNKMVDAKQATIFVSEVGFVAYINEGESKWQPKKS